MALDSVLIACVRLIMGDPEYDAIWQERTTAWRASAGAVSIAPIAVSGIGVDEVRTAIEGVASEIRERIYGTRLVKVQFMCEADDQDAGQDAGEIAEKLAEGFARSDVEALLAAERLGGVRVQARRLVPYEDAHHDSKSVCIFEVWINHSRTGGGPLVPFVLSAEITGSDQEDPPAVIVGPIVIVLP